MGLSEVSRLREQIELEYQAAYNALHAPAIITPHAFINAKLASIQEHKEQLAHIVGEQRAMEIVMAVMEKTEETRHGDQTRPIATDQSATAL
jgi:hypothetical protein